MTFNLPRLRFADTNTLEEQINHIDSELVEVNEAFDDAECMGGCWHRVTEEIADLMQSCATALYIIERDHGISPLCAIENVKAKNKARGYEL